MKFSAFVFLALACQVSALTIKIDYTYDTSNFFNTQAKRSAIENAAKFYGDLIRDNLLRIDPADFPGASWSANSLHPGTGASLSISNLVVPEDTIIVYVGSRNLSGNTLAAGGPGGFNASGFTPWVDRIRGRGNAGATGLAGSQSDHAPWGGSITFDADSTWNFSQTQNHAGFEFINVALHELGHVLGIGTANSWFNKISGSVFTGAAATRSNGIAPPLQAGGGHFRGSTLASQVFGSFGRNHGLIRPVLMLASSIDEGSNFDVASDLDLAALIDCGWEIHPPLVLSFTSLNPSAAAFTWNSSSFLNYRVERGSDLQSFPGGSSVIAGDGTVRNWVDPAAPASNTFYRLGATNAITPAASAARVASVKEVDHFRTISIPPRFVEGCYECDH